MNKKLWLIILWASIVGCKAYKQDIMFKLDKDFTEEDLATVIDTLEKNYVLKPNDILNLILFTNDGEMLIDPNRRFGGFGQGNNVNGNPNRGQGQGIGGIQYVIQADGDVYLPLLGNVNLEGLTLLNAELKLAHKYDSIYKDSFIKLKIDNRRVFLLGELGGRVINLPNENTSVIEVIAQGGGVRFGAKAQNIKLIRGDLVYRIDLSTVSGYKESVMNVKPGDVIYVEPWRQVWLEVLRDIGPILSTTSSLLALIIVIQNFNI